MRRRALPAAALLLLAVSAALALRVADAGVVITHNPENETKADAQLRGQAMIGDNVAQTRAALEQTEASVWNRDLNGQTVLHHAMHRSLAGVSRLLLVTHGADPNAADSAGCTPLFFASYAGFAKGVQMLLKKGADCNVRDQLGQTALHSVASALDEVKKRWLKPSEDGSHQGYFTIYQPTKGPGQADERHTRVAQLLIEKCKLDPLDKNDAGDTAVDLARRYDFHEMVALFEKLAPAAKLSAAEQAEYDARKPPEKAEPTAPAFAAFDLDRDGVVVRDELAEALTKLKPDQPPPSDQQVDMMLEQADTDKSGEVDQAEFAEIFGSVDEEAKALREQKLAAAAEVERGEDNDDDDDEEESSDGEWKNDVYDTESAEDEDGPLDARAIEQEIRKIYEVHNPKNLRKVSALMEEYEGSELQLLATIMKKYGLDIDDKEL